MVYPINMTENTRIDLINRIFFKLYQCANMMHKTGTRAVQDEGLTTQQWAVLGALSRQTTSKGISIGDLARYLMVSRQNLAGVVTRMERDGHVTVIEDMRDRRSRLVVLTDSGRHVWIDKALPKINEYYLQAMSEFSTTDMTHTLHYLAKLLDNMGRVDQPAAGEVDEIGQQAQRG
jgi:DNA-binding MarR family transcriptional regulator